MRTRQFYQTVFNNILKEKKGNWEKAKLECSRFVHEMLLKPEKGSEKIYAWDEFGKFFFPQSKIEVGVDIKENSELKKYLLGLEVEKKKKDFEKIKKQLEILEKEMIENNDNAEVGEDPEIPEENDKDERSEEVLNIGNSEKPNEEEKKPKGRPKKT